MNKVDKVKLELFDIKYSSQKPIVKPSNSSNDKK